MNLKEVFRYAVILVPLNLAFPDSTQRQDPKHHFCNYLINVSKTYKLIPPNEACYRYYVNHEKVIKVKATFKNSLPAANYMFKVNKRNTRTRCEICSKLTIKISEQRQWHRSGIFIVSFEHISHVVLVFLLLTLNSKYRLG